MDDDVLQKADALIRRQRNAATSGPALPLLDEVEDDLPLLVDEVEEIIELQPTGSPPVLKAGLLDALVEQRLAQVLPEHLETELTARLHGAVEARMAFELPGRVERALQSRLGEAVEARLEQVLPQRVEAEVAARLPAAVDAQMALELPERVRKTIAAQLGTTASETGELSEDVAQTIEAAVASRLAVQLPQAVEAALPSRLEAALNERLDVLDAWLKAGLQDMLERWLNAHLPLIVGQELERFSGTVLKRAQNEARATLALDMDGLLTGLRTKALGGTSSSDEAA